MKLDRINIARGGDRLALWFGAGAIVTAVFILLLRVVVHFPFFDESLHVHYLWLLSNGYKPGVDFYCHYPSLAYLLMAPFFNLLPDSAFVVLVLRYVSVAIYAGVGILFYLHGRKVTGDWVAAVMPLLLLASAGNIGPFMAEYSIDPLAAAAAVGAMVVFFRTPSERTIALAAGLSLLSVLVTPKYVFPLFFGLIGHVAAYVLTSREKVRTAAAIGAGGTAALAFALIVYWLSGVSFLDNLSTTLTTSGVVRKMNEIFSYSFIIKRLLNKPAYELLVLLGLLGWGVRSRGRLDQITLAGAGMLLGLVLFFFTICLPLEQYQMPVYLSLAMFAPFAFSVWDDTVGVKIVRCLVVAAVFIVLANRCPTVLGEFMGTSVYVRDADNPRTPKGVPALKMLADLDQLLRVIPRNEKVVALWPHHPMFRKDLTGITWDERPSYSEVLSKDNPNAAFFDPNTYIIALEKQMPALIEVSKLQTNYPPRWYEITYQFLAKNGASYVRLPSKVEPGRSLYLRRDLVPQQSGGGSAL